MAVPALSAIKQTLATPVMKEQVAAALPRHVGVDKFIRTTLTVLSQNPDLVKCERSSLMGSIMSAASLGLMPENFLGEAYIVPYKGKATLQVGYKGLLALARRSGEISNISHGVVYEKDEYIYEQGDDSHLMIKPFMGNSDPGPAIFAWCVITLKDGSKQREVMKAYEVEAIRMASPSKNSPAWRNSWGEMARKTVLKRALKTAPRSTEMDQALALDNVAEGGGTAIIEAGVAIQTSPAEKAPEEKPKQTRKPRLKKLAEDAAPDTPKEEPAKVEPTGAEDPGAGPDDGPVTLDEAGELV